MARTFAIWLAGTCTLLLGAALLSAQWLSHPSRSSQRPSRMLISLSDTLNETVQHTITATAHAAGQVQGAIADVAAAPLADRVEDGIANSSILQLVQRQRPPAEQSAEAAAQERPSMAERFSHAYVSALPPVMQISDMEQHMEDALTLPVTAVKAAFNLTKAIIAPDGDMQQASAPGVAVASDEDMPAAPEQGPSTQDAAAEEDAWAEQDAEPEQEAPAMEEAPAAEAATQREPAAEWGSAADEGLPAQGPSAKESSAEQQAAFSLFMVQQGIEVAGAQSAVGVAESVAMSDAVSTTSTDSDTGVLTQNDTLHRALQPQGYSIAQEGRQVVRSGKDVAPIILAVNASLPTDSAAGSATAPSSAATEDISIASASSAEVVARWVVVFQHDTPDSEVAQYCSSSAATYGFTCKTQMSLLLKAMVIETAQTQLSAFLVAAGNAVQYVRQDEAVQLSTTVENLSVAAIGTTMSAGLWGLDRVDQRSSTRDYAYHYNAMGTGVHIYVADTGINPTHIEFYSAAGASRVGAGYTFDGVSTADCNGHGSHISGTAAGLNVGVAKNATIHPVRVIDCDGSGSIAQIIAGLEWISGNAELPAVVLMSIGGTATAVLDTAVQALTNQGITVVVAAGNSAEDACDESPARQPSVIAVAATDSSDNMASFSDGGACVELLAPGVSILSVGYSTNTGYVVMSGTSMSAPHVVGIAALYLENNPSAAPFQVSAVVQSSAEWGCVSSSSLMAATPNAIANSLLVDPLITSNVPLTNGGSQLSYINITDSNYKNGYAVAITLSSQPAGTVTVTTTVDDASERLSVLNNAVLTFTPTSWSTVQTMRLSVVRNRPAGWNEVLLDFFVQTTAAADSWISDTHHKMPVFDARSLPGDTVSFPALIMSLPYQGVGDTTYYNNDYNVTTCTGQSTISETQGSPDYVYAFMPATNATVSISLCNSGYDTKLIVYQSASDGQLLEVLCNDDYCNLQSWAEVALSANVLYYFVVDGFNGAAGTWAIDIEAMDNSTVAGQLISGTYALAEYSASGNSTNSTTTSSVADPPPEPYLIAQTWGDCQCGQAMQDTSATCHNLYQVLPLAVCVDAASTPARYEPCDPTCPANSTGNHFEPGPWGPISAQCNSTQQTRTGTCLSSAGTATTATSCSSAVTSRPAATAPCIQNVWQVAAWSACSKSCGSGGTQSRSVHCVQFEGLDQTTVGDSLCSGTKPASTQSCNMGTSCNFCKGQSCSGQGTCSSTKQACVCDSGYKGTFCSIPTNCTGALDADGACCEYELTRAGVCCPSGQLDGNQDCCSGVVDAVGVCGGGALAIDWQGDACEGTLDAQGRCCTGILDSFGVCNGYDSSGDILVSASMSATTGSLQVSLLAGALGIGAANISAYSASSTPTSSTSRRRALLQAGLIVDGLAAAAVPSTTTAAPATTGAIVASTQAVVQYQVAAQSPSSLAITSAALTVGQAERLLSNSSDIALSSVQALPVCGNGVCEVGERPNVASVGLTAKGGCATDCPVPYTSCPIPSGSLSMCGGPPRGICSTATGACSCSTGYSGSDCSSCTAGYTRQGTRCITTGADASSSAAGLVWWIIVIVIGVGVVLAVALGALFVAWRLRAARQRRAAAYAATADDKLQGPPAAKAPIGLSAYAGSGQPQGYAQPRQQVGYRSAVAAPQQQQPTSYDYPGPRPLPR